MVYQEILALDKALFFVINGGSNPVFNFLMPLLTYFGDFFIWLGFSAILLLKKQKKAGVSLLITLGLNALLVLGLKEVFLRPRPLELPGANILARESSASFPSGHSAIAFSSAEIIGKYYPAFKMPLYLLAVVTAFSRIYIGVHYPLDTLAGALVGLGTGAFVARLPIDKIVDSLQKKWARGSEKKRRVKARIKNSRIGKKISRIRGIGKRENSG